MDMTKLETRNEETEDDTIDDAIAAVEEIRTAVTQNQKAADEERKKLEDDQAAFQKRMDDFEKRLARPNIQTNAVQQTEEQRAFDALMRHGPEEMKRLEVRNLATDANGGGFLAPTQFISEIVKNLVQFSPIRTYARVMSIGVSSATLPKRTGAMTAAWVTETGTRPGTEPTYDSVDLTPHEAAAYVDVSNALLEDNTYNLESELAMDFAEEFGRLEGLSFVSGTGVGQPEGLLTNTDIPEINSRDAAGFDADSLIDFFHNLPSPYAQNGTWLMNRTTMGETRKLKNSAGDYLWREALSEGNPPTLLGRPIAEAVDMPDIAADATPILFGDISQTYRIADRIQLSILRDPYTQAPVGQTRFHARRRVGARVLKAEASRKLKIAA